MFRSEYADVPAVDLPIHDPGKDLGPGEAGELLFRGPQVMKGYLGRPDATAAMIEADGTEVPHAHVVRRPDAAGLSEGEVLMYVAERVAPYKRVRKVTFVDAVPRAASGKILRRELRERA